LTGSGRRQITGEPDEEKEKPSVYVELEASGRRLGKSLAHKNPIKRMGEPRPIQVSKKKPKKKYRELPSESSSFGPKGGKRVWIGFQGGQNKILNEKGRRLMERAGGDEVQKYFIRELFTMFKDLVSGGGGDCSW